jgi:hypothetical protein
MCGSMRDQMGQLGESGKYRMGRVRVVYFYVRSTKGGSPHLCRMRIDSLAPVSKIDYVLTHIGLWVS